MGKKEFQKLAEETVTISKNSFYMLNNKKISFNTDDGFILFKTPVKTSKLPNAKKGVIEINQESTLSAIHRMHGSNLGVLNFASARYPSGGFLNGSMAQEECLAYCSNLFLRQSEKGIEYYLSNRNSISPHYTDNMFIDNVTFFRDADFNLIERPIQCKVLTAPAVNKNNALLNGSNEKEILITMKNRMRKILECFIFADCTDIILGAFGCGVFGNSPENVANIWKELLYNEKYIYHFNNVCFSILDNSMTNNYEIFKKVFS